ncbi:coilin isoform X1 [Trichosurus vulpecula]|uniref:coilin isoform X1 n=1 Tax=Trichosurus vulpecula TaxID=9337 RepID=UPI00186B0276|nr:coilin isoform X1 [Trichosurus vulpecula]
MAASETVRLRLHFDYPPPSSPRCSVFWLLADLTKCRVVTDLASLIRHRFGFSSGAALALYLEGGLLPPTESARLVRDNDCLRVKLEDVEVVENSVVVSNGLGYSHKKTRKRRTTWEEEESDAENNQYTEKHWKRGEISETSSSLEQDQGTRKKNKKRKRNEGGSENSGKWTPKKSGKEKEGKAENKKQKKSPKPSKAKKLPERTKKSHSVQKSASSQSNAAEIKRKKDIGLSAKANPDTSSDSDSSATSSDDSHTKMSLGGKKLVEKPSFITSKPTGSHPTADRLVSIGSNAPSVKGKGTQESSSSLDSSSSTDDQGRMPKRAPALAPPPTGTTVSPGSSQANGPDTDNHLGTRQEMRYSHLWDKPILGNSGKQLTPLAPEAAPHPSSFGRGRGRGEDIFPWRGPRGRGFRGIRGRGRGGNINYVFNGESQKQQQLTEVVKNTSIIIQNPAETPQKDYSLLPQLAAPPRVGEKIAFKLLELTADYSPDVSSYKTSTGRLHITIQQDFDLTRMIKKQYEGRIINYNSDAQEVDIEILSSLPVVKEPGKFDLVYQNENGTEVVEYAVSQDKRITICWKELIEPRLIIEPHADPPSTEQA